MIAEIVKGSSAKEFIDYNEDKVERDLAERIEMPNYGIQPHELNFYFENQASKNERLRKNKFIHLIISFSEQDQVSNQKFLKIWDDYSKEMGYNKAEQVIYQHKDTRLNHYHIVMPTVTPEGVKIRDFNDFYNSRDISRKIEKTHNLQPVVYSALFKRHMHSENAQEFSIYNFLGKKKEQQQVKIGDTLLHTIRKYRLDNKAIRDIYSDFNQTSYEELKKLADKFTQNNRMELIEKIRSIRDNSRNYTDFQKNLNAHGLFIKKKVGKDRKTYMTYGNKETGTYIKDNKLPKDLQYGYLFNYSYENNPHFFTSQDQANYLKNIAFRCKRQSQSLTEYFEQLQSYNVDVQTKSNKNGIYAYSLKSLNISNGIHIPSTQIHRNLSIAKLGFTSHEKKQEPSITTSSQKTTSPKITIGKIAKHLDHEKEAQEEEYKRQQQQRNLE